MTYLEKTAFSHFFFFCQVGLIETVCRSQGVLIITKNDEWNLLPMKSVIRPNTSFQQQICDKYVF